MDKAVALARRMAAGAHTYQCLHADLTEDSLLFSSYCLQLLFVDIAVGIYS